VLEAHSVQVAEERSSRKQPLSHAEVRALLGAVKEVLVARGRKVVALGDKAKPADLKGPSGNYRAPMVVKGKTLLVGFNEDALRDLL
jgi:arsenate reductase-like glutaredoxin family protein